MKLFHITGTGERHGKEFYFNRNDGHFSVQSSITGIGKI